MLMVLALESPCKERTDKFRRRISSETLLRPMAHKNIEDQFGYFFHDLRAIGPVLPKTSVKFKCPLLLFNRNSFRENYVKACK